MTDASKTTQIDDCPPQFDNESASFYGGWQLHKMGRPCPSNLMRPHAARGWREREQITRAVEACRAG